MSRFHHIAMALCSGPLAAWSDAVYLDEGASAEVYQVRAGDRRAALKVFDPTFFQGAQRSASIERIYRQQQLIGQKHPHLVEIMQATEAAEWQTWFILMEFVPPPNLKKALPDIPSSAARGLIRQLVEVVRWLEGQGLYHRDIKPANIAVDPTRNFLKLLDLGILRRSTPDEFGTDERGQRQFIATVQYSSPEYIVRNEWGTSDEVLHALNIYQVGAVLYDLLTCSPLFGDVARLNNKYRLFEEIRDTIPVIPPGADHDLRQLAGDCLLKDPRERIRRVTWDRFFADPEDPAAARSRLRQLTAGGVGAASDNFARIRLENTVRALRATAVAALHDSPGIFPPHATRDHSAGPNRASVSIILTGTPPLLAGAEFRFNLTVTQGTPDGPFEIFVSAEMTASDAPFREANMNAVPFSMGNEEILGATQARELLGDRFVILYDKGRAALAAHAAAGTRPALHEDVA